jgi:2-polyprenyl-3-methyl-5-hydroxy-6-metoxy-1,4-benzoquinol methylase
MGKGSLDVIRCVDLLIHVSWVNSFMWNFMGEALDSGKNSGC